MTTDATLVRNRSMDTRPQPVDHAVEVDDHFLSDEQMLIEYRESGDRELFAQLVGRYERELYSYLRRYLGDAEMAEDVFQATFLQVHLKRDQFEEGRRFRPWLYTIATNQAIDCQRRNRRHRTISLDRLAGQRGAESPGKLADLLVSGDIDPLVSASEQERGEWVQGAVERLSDQMRNVVHLVYYQGFKYREAAEMLNIPVGTVKSRLHAAIMKLNEIWKDTHAESSQP
jgi:RNA polymerase sigma-70 factor, ECF subfamily